MDALSSSPTDHTPRTAVRRARPLDIAKVAGGGPDRFVGPVFLFLLLAILLLGGCSDDNAAPTAASAEDEPGIAAFTSPQQGVETKQQAEEDERLLRIGVIGPETGPQASYGLSVLEGVLAAARRVNGAGGVGGVEIEVVHYDNEGAAASTQASVRDLIDQRVVAILSAPTGWSTFAPIHMANESHTIFISIGTRRHVGKSGPYVFRAALPDEIATDELIKYAAERFGYSGYAMVTSSTYDSSLDVSASFKKAIAKHGGVLKVEADTYDSYSGKSDMAKVVDTIMRGSSDVHGLIFTGGPQEGVRLAHALREAGSDLPILGGEELFTADYLHGGDAVRGSLVYATFSPGSDSAKAVEFRKEYGKHEPDRFAALAYDCLMLLTEAIETAGTTRSSSVREALLAIRNFEGVTGEMGFTPAGSPVKHPFIHEVRKGESKDRFVLLTP
jgi:branched-chain amino acid transport system substrate-binding protein